MIKKLKSVIHFLFSTRNMNERYTGDGQKASDAYGELKNLTAELMTFSDALQFAEVLEEVVKRRSNEIATKAVQYEIDNNYRAVSNKVSNLQDLIINLDQKISFIESEAFLDSIVERLLKKQL